MGENDSPRLHAIDTERAGAGIIDEKIVATTPTRGRCADRRTTATRDRVRSRRRRRAGTGTRSRAPAPPHRQSRRRRDRTRDFARAHRCGRALTRRSRSSKTSRRRTAIAVGRTATAHRRTARQRGPVVAFTRAVVLATGGIGRLYAITTNPWRRAATASRWRRAPAPLSPTWSSCSSIRPRWRSGATRCRWPPKRCAAKARSSSTISANASCWRASATPNSGRATSSRARSSNSSSGPHRRSRRAHARRRPFPGRVSDRFSAVSCGRHRPATQHSGRAGRPLSHGRHCGRRHAAAPRWQVFGRAVKRLDRRPRREPPRHQLAARSRLRRAYRGGYRGPGDRRTCAPAGGARRPPQWRRAHPCGKEAARDNE